MPKETRQRLKLSDFIDELQSEGRYSFSTGEVSRACASSEVAIQSSIRRLKQKGRLVSPRRGFLVVVPPEYRSTGSPPASWFVDDLMTYLNRRYYVGLLSAAVVHGASHQQPQVFQVVTDLPMEPMTAGRVKIEFFRKRSIDRVLTMRVKTETGYMAVSSPEATVFDLIRHTHAVGHLSNVATVLAELGEIIDPGKLAAAALESSHSEVQRAGYLLELVGHDALATPLAELVSSRRRRPILLRSDLNSKGASLDERWQILVNEKVEPDL